jgi:hypothetical protein
VGGGKGVPPQAAERVHMPDAQDEVAPAPGGQLGWVGNATSARAADFKAFLSTNVARVDVSWRATFDPALANQCDLVLLDWPQSESKGQFPPKKAPLGERAAWTKPTVLLDNHIPCG